MSDGVQRIIDRMRIEREEMAKVPVDWQPHDPACCPICYVGAAYHPAGGPCQELRNDGTPRSPRWVRACGCTDCVPGDGWRTCPCGCHQGDQRRLYEAKGRYEALAELNAGE